MQTFAFIIVTLFVIALIFIAVEGAIGLIIKINLGYKNRVVLNRKIYLKFEPHEDACSLYKGHKLIDDSVILFEYKSSFFYLLSLDKKYIVKKYDKDVQIVEMEKLKEKDQKVFEKMQNELLDIILFKQAYFKKVEESLKTEL